MHNAFQFNTRRQFVQSAVAGSLLMPGLLSELLGADGSGAAGSPTEAAIDPTNPTAPRPSHFPAKAKSVIFLFMSGGVSHVDSFDPKPQLFADHGKQVIFDHPETRNRPGYEKIYLKRPDWNFAPHGQSGIEVSELFPHIANQIDDISMIRSMHTSHSNHYNATLGMHTGSFAFARPSIGSWLSYGLGTTNQNLPSFIALAPQMPYAGTQIFNNDFLPAYHQGVRVVGGKEPIANLNRRTTQRGVQELELGLADVLNNRHLQKRANDSDLSARIRSFETAFSAAVFVGSYSSIMAIGAATMASA